MNGISLLVIIGCFVAGYVVISLLLRMIKSFGAPEWRDTEATRAQQGSAALPNADMDRLEWEDMTAPPGGFAPESQAQLAAAGFPGDQEKYYASVLGLRGQITRDALLNQYLAMTAQYHPDKVQLLEPHLRQAAADELQLINEAYMFLRERYDH
jgi:hypothetical protein